jgi:multidrug efflux pump subunit AcrB
MGELTGPVLGITLVLTAVFLPASFLPGITGQMFRQFALVIAATAIISVINALTLKPTQCALYLRPVPRDRQLNWFYLYQDWDQRPPGFSQTNLLPEIQKKLLSIRNAQVAALPPSPIRGLGNAFGFQMVIEDRAGAGLRELQQAVQQILGTAQNRPGFLRIGLYHLQRQQPAALSGYRQNHDKIDGRHGQRCLQNLTDLFRIDLR